jgi:hypothetical protein
MKDLSRFAALSACTVVSAWFVAACGSYDNPSKGTGGTGGTMMAGGTGGTMPGTGGAMAGTGGANAAGTGGGAGMATGGAAGAGGGAGMATGGTAGASGDGAGGAPMAGSAGDAGMSGSAGSGGPSCEDVAPCGGELVGTWTAAGCDMAVTGMANLAPAGIGCVAAPVTGSLKVTGTWTAVAGGMFMDDTSTKGQVTLELAPECLEISGFMGTCDRLGFDSTGMVGAVCADNTTTMGCTCTVMIDQAGGLGAINLEASLGNAKSGTYTTADNKLKTTSAPGDLEYPYCVAGTTLTMTLAVPSNVGTLMGPIVLQAQ